MKKLKLTRVVNRLLSKLFNVDLSDLFLLFLILLFSGCSYQRMKGSLQSGPETWFHKITRTILQPKCMGCHAGPDAKKGFDFSSYDSVMGTHGIVPYKPLESPLYNSIKSGHMPMGMPRLSEADVNMVYNWVNTGALSSTMVGTDKPPDPPEPPKPTYTWLQKNLFIPKCKSCHDEKTPKGKTDFTTYESLLASEGEIDTPIVKGKPLSSSVYTSVRGDNMPDTPEKLKPEEKKAIFDWIKNGAKKD